MNDDSFQAKGHAGHAVHVGRAREKLGAVSPGMPTEEATEAASLVARAQAVAEAAHLGQRDRAGLPYIDHPKRVAEAVSARLGASHPATPVAWLHDVVEDTHVTVEDLVEMFGADIARAVDAVSRREGESADEYYARVRANEWALTVKTADLDDNSREDRLALLAPSQAQRLRDKYAHARRVLCSSAYEEG